MPSVRLFLRLLVDPGWAPMVVGLAFVLLAGTGIAERFDYVFHFAGGAAAAFFVWRTIALVPGLASRYAGVRRGRASLAGALTIAVLWEALEFVADRTLGTRLQHGAIETLRDVAFGVGGAVLVVLVAVRVSD